MIASQTVWSIDQAKSSISFKVDPVIFSSVEGYFRKFEATILTNADDFSSIEIDLRIDAASITTGDPERDEHLKSPDFFDVEKYSQILFRSTSVKLSDKKDQHELKGNVTIKGITKPVSATVAFDGLISDPSGNDNALFTISAIINRKDWGLLWNEGETTGGVMESENVSINCRIILNKQGMEFIG